MKNIVNHTKSLQKYSHSDLKKSQFRNDFEKNEDSAISLLVKSIKPCSVCLFKLNLEKRLNFDGKGIANSPEKEIELKPCRTYVKNTCMDSVVKHSSDEIDLHNYALSNITNYALISKNFKADNHSLIETKEQGKECSVLDLSCEKSITSLNAETNLLKPCCVEIDRLPIDEYLKSITFDPLKLEKKFGQNVVSPLMQDDFKENGNDIGRNHEKCPSLVEKKSKIDDTLKMEEVCLKHISKQNKIIIECADKLQSVSKIMFKHNSKKVKISNLHSKDEKDKARYVRSCYVALERLKGDKCHPNNVRGMKKVRSKKLKDHFPKFKKGLSDVPKNIHLADSVNSELCVPSISVKKRKGKVKEKDSDYKITPYYMKKVSKSNPSKRVSRHCNSQVNYREVEEKHFEDRTVKNNFMCVQCYKFFSCEKSLYDHLCFGKQKRGYVCEICEKIYKTKVCFQKHKLSHALK